MRVTSVNFVVTAGAAPAALGSSLPQRCRRIEFQPKYDNSGSIRVRSADGVVAHEFVPGVPAPEEWCLESGSNDLYPSDFTVDGDSTGDVLYVSFQEA